MSLKLKQFASGILASLVVVSSLTINPVAAGDTNAAVTYLKSQTVSAWVAMGLGAASETADVSSLKTVSGDKATDYAAAILGLTAQGKDPRSYPSTDFVAKLKTFHTASQLGDATIINDDIFGILALVSAGVPVSDQVIVDSKAYIISHQNADGGWSFASSGSSDTNDTSAAIMALMETGMPKTDQVIAKAINYLKAAQNADGGFPYDPQSPWGTDTDAPSTGWVISAINRLGEDAQSWTKEGHNPVDALLALQAPSGFFRYQAGSEADSFTSVTTAYGVVALSGKYFPVAKFTPTYPKVTFRIAGGTGDLCSGDAFAPNPLMLVQIVAESCGFTYNITSTAFGPYLDRIGSETAGGVMGWLYNVNDAEPSVGAVDYELQANDSVLWHFNDFNDKLTRISLSASEIEVGGSVTVSVESRSGSDWVKLPGATVHFTGSVATTDAEGRAVITDLAGGAYKFYATKTGFVRSETESLAVGGTVDRDINLSATLSGGAGGGGGGGAGGAAGISFTLSTPSEDGSLGFGEVVRGVPMQKTVIIHNSGDVNFHIESNVTGADLFRSYLTIGATPWRMYEDIINHHESRNVSVGLNVPETYTSGGSKTGKLTFWAIQAN